MQNDLNDLLASLTFRSNPNLRPSGTQISYTQEMMDEVIKCKLDPQYFIENYVYIVHPDRGIVKMTLYPYQKNMIKTYHDNRRSILLTPRQFGKTISAAVYLLWYVLFNSNKTVAILANKQATADEILHRVRLAYENIPKWLQQGVEVFNRRSIELENGSRMFCSATSSSGIRGKTINCVTGDTEIVVCDDDLTNVRKMTIKKLYTNATSSINKYENITTNGGDFHMEQIINIELTQNCRKTKYHNIYDRLIDKAKQRDLSELAVYEKHHIIPRSFGGSDEDDNIVNLSLREHFLAHKLLIKMTVGKERSKMLMALYMMSNTRGIRLSSRVYAEAKMACREWFSRPMDDHTKKILSDIQINLWADPEYKAKMTAIFNSDECSSKKSSSIKSWIENNPEKHNERMNKINKNPEKIRKTAEWHTGKKRPKETGEKISQKKKGIPAKNKGTLHYFNVETCESIQLLKGEIPPIGWVRGTGVKVHNRGKWFHKGNEIRAFKNDEIVPHEWKPGRKDSDEGSF